MFIYISRRLYSLRYAIEGIQYVLNNHPNFLIHTLFSAVVFSLFLTLKVSLLELLIYLVVATIGLISELVNTSIELITDIASTGWRKEAKMAKDVAAGSVLIAVGLESAVAMTLMLSYFQGR